MIPEIINILSQHREPYNRHEFNSVFFKLVGFSSAVSFLVAKISDHLPPWLIQALTPLLSLMWVSVSVFIFVAIIRRLRNLQWSPWLAAIMVIPFPNFILLLFLLFKKGTSLK